MSGSIESRRDYEMISPSYNLVLKDGTVVTASRITAFDCVQISAMTELNFRQAPSYQQLTPDARKKYIEANSPEGVLETSQHPDNLVSLVVRDAEDNVVGFRVVRKGIHKYDGEPVAEGKRLHVALDYAGNGLGTELMNLSEVLVKQAGYKRMVVNSSGDSYHFFLTRGFKVVEHTQNPILLEQGVVANLVYMEKTL